MTVVTQQSAWPGRMPASDLSDEASASAALMELQTVLHPTM